MSHLSHLQGGLNRSTRTRSAIDLGYPLPCTVDEMALERAKPGFNAAKDTAATMCKAIRDPYVL
jgi:hypothetical protein